MNNIDEVVSNTVINASYNLSAEDLIALGTMAKGSEQELLQTLTKAYKFGYAMGQRAIKEG